MQVTVRNQQRITEHNGSPGRVIMIQTAMPSLAGAPQYRLIYTPVIGRHPKHPQSMKHLPDSSIRLPAISESNTIGTVSETAYLTGRCITFKCESRLASFPDVTLERALHHRKYHQEKNR